METKLLDRKHAGHLLANMLADEYKNTDALLLAIPRGGVEVGDEIANALNLHMDVLIAKIIPDPVRTDLPIGAAAEDGSVYLSENAKSYEHAALDRITIEVLANLNQRAHRYRNHPLPGMKDKCVILVDDGKSMGCALLPALKMLHTRQPSKIVVASPVVKEKYLNDIKTNADELYVLNECADSSLYQNYYYDLRNIDEEKVLSYLSKWQHA
jgi:putative phosphoribosyl transferase